MRPSYHPGDIYGESNDNVTNRFTQTWHQNGKCPENTIPIRRTKEEHNFRAISVRKMARIDPNLISIQDPDTPYVLKGHLHAVASTQGQEDKYYGTQATFNVWQPTLGTNNDFSLAQLWISSGSYENNDLNTIEVGWEVYPDLYKDSNTRLFIFWTHDAYQSKPCYNLCPGFIQTNNQIAIGGRLTPISSYSGNQYEITILVWKDPTDGNWWLQVGSHVLGYWPSSVFTNLAESASNIQWGGEVYSASPGQTSTQMGSGHFPEEGFRKASYIKNIQVVDSSNSLKSPKVVVPLAEQSNCYRALNGTASSWGTYIFFGGPGKNPNCQ